MPVTIPAVNVVRETIYLGRTNKVRLEITQYDYVTDTFAPVSFTTVAAYKIELVNADNPAVVLGPFSSLVDTEIASSPSAGLVDLELGGLAIPEGRYWLRLCVIDPQDFHSQVIHEDGPLHRVLLTVSEA